MSKITRKSDTHQFLSWGARAFISAPSSSVLFISVILILLTFMSAVAASFYISIDKTIKSTGITDSIEGVKDTIALTGGQINTLLIKEGDIVVKDQIIGNIRIDGADESELSKFVSQLKVIQQVCVQQAHCNISNFELLTIQDTELKQSVAEVYRKFSDLSYAETELRTKLASEIYPLKNRLHLINSKLSYLAGSKMRNYLQMQKESMDEEKGRIEQQITSTQNQLSNKIRDVKVEAIHALNFAIFSFEKFINNHKLKAAVSGKVARIIKTEGSYIANYEKVLTIIPADSPIIAKVQIAPKDMGKIKDGDPAYIGIDAYPAHKFGYFEGKVLSIDKVRANEANGEQAAAFVARISINVESLHRKPAMVLKDEGIRIVPGMNIDARIVTGKATIISMFLDRILGKER